MSKLNLSDIEIAGPLYNDGYAEYTVGSLSHPDIVAYVVNNAGEGFWRVTPPDSMSLSSGDATAASHEAAAAVLIVAGEKLLALNGAGR